MEHAYHDPAYVPARKGSSAGLVGATDVLDGVGGWRRIALPAPPTAPRDREAAAPSSIVVSLAWQHHERCWVIDLPLLAILGMGAGLVGLGLVGKLLYAGLMWAL